MNPFEFETSFIKSLLLLYNVLLASWRHCVIRNGSVECVVIVEEYNECLAYRN